MNKRKDVIVKPEILKLSVKLPASVVVANTGNYVAQIIKEETDIVLPTNTSNAITLLAKDGAKEKMRLDEVSLEIGNVTWLPLKLSWKWKRK